MFEPGRDAPADADPDMAGWELGEPARGFHLGRVTDADRAAMASGDLPPMVFLGMQVKKRESLSPDQLPRRRAAFPSSLRAISTVSKFREHGKYGAVSYRPIIKSLRCEKITPTKLDQ